MQGASLVPILKGNKPTDWRGTHYYHYYEYPGWHMVQRHEGVYYKLMNFYDVKEWELYDLESDPKEMVNVYDDAKYADEKKRLHEELVALRVQYDVPENQLKDLTNVDMHYHSEEILKRGLERKKQREAAAAKKAQGKKE